MRISISSGTFYHRGLRHSLRLAREAGYDGVELAIGPESVFRDDASLARIAREGEAPVLSVHPPFYPLPGWPRHVADRLDRLVDVTCAVGAPVLVLHAPTLRSAEAPATRAYTRLIERAQARADGRLRICIENMQHSRNPHHRHLLDDLATLVRFATERGCGVTFDTCHSGANREDLLASYEIVRPVLGNVHLSDVIWHGEHPETHVIPGEGTLPLGDLLAAMARDGYDGLVTFEIHPRHAGLLGHARQLRRMRKAIGFVREAIAEGVASPAGEVTT